MHHLLLLTVSPAISTSSFYHWLSQPLFTNNPSNVFQGWQAILREWLLTLKGSFFLPPMLVFLAKCLYLLPTQDLFSSPLIKVWGTPWPGHLLSKERLRNPNLINKEKSWFCGAHQCLDRKSSWGPGTWQFTVTCVIMKRQWTKKWNEKFTSDVKRKSPHGESRAGWPKFLCNLYIKGFYNLSG